MFRCLKCNLEFGDHVPDYCPVCYTIPYVCPWCGSMTDASARCCTAEGCGQPIKYVHVPPDHRDVMRLRRSEALQIGGVTLVVERALYATDRATVYQAKVVDSISRRTIEPGIGSTVAVREVVGEWSPRVQALVPKLAELRHPNIVRTYAGEPDAERCCYRLLQSWVGERTLASAYLSEHGGRAAEPAELAKAAVSLSGAIRYLHSRGIIHCDVTPFNVLLDRDGTFVLADFGIAALADDPGPPRGYASSYAPVESYPAHKMPTDVADPGWPIGPHTDRYMLGATLYAIACGRDGRSPHPVTMTSVLVPSTDRLRYERALGGVPQAPLRALKPDVDERFAECVETMLSVQPDARYKSDAEMVKRVKSACRGLGKRRFLRLPALRGFRKHAKAIGAAAALLVFVFLSRHSYSLVHSPENLPAFAVSDAWGLFGRSAAALATLDGAPAPSAEVDYARGRALERMGKQDEALKMYKSSVALDAGFDAASAAAERARARLGNASLQLGMQFYRSGERLEAYEHLSKAAHYGACSVTGYRALADICERRGQLAQAAGFWDIVSTRQPGAVRPHYEAALLFLDSGNLEKAYHHTAKARDLHLRPKPEEDISPENMRELLEEVTEACVRAGNIDISRTTSLRRIYDRMVWLNRAKNLLPSAAVLVKLGRYYERLGDLSSGDRKINYYDQAVDCLQRARKLQPGSGSVNTILARCLAKQKRASG